MLLKRKKKKKWKQKKKHIVGEGVCESAKRGGVYVCVCVWFGGERVCTASIMMTAMMMLLMMRLFLWQQRRLLLPLSLSLTLAAASSVGRRQLDMRECCWLENGILGRVKAAAAAAAATRPAVDVCFCLPAINGGKLRTLPHIFVSMYTYETTTKIDV